MVPMAIEWSPPRTSGVSPAPMLFETLRAGSSITATISGRYRSFGSSTSRASGSSELRLPSSMTSYSRSRSRCRIPALRIADGPMSTPRRPAPRSMRTPMIRMMSMLARSLPRRGCAILVWPDVMLGQRLVPALLIPLALSRFTPSCIDLSEPGAASLSDVEFSRLIHQVSEEGGYFWSNNYISNETSYLHVLDDLEKLPVKGGV